MIQIADVKTIISGLKQEWDELSKRRSRLEDYMFDPRRGCPDENDSHEEPDYSEENFYIAVKRFKNLLGVVYEALSLNESKTQLEAALSKQAKGDGFEYTAISEFDAIHCPAINILSSYFDALKLCFDEGKPQQLILLERILKNGGYHVTQYTKRETRIPSCEDDVQKAMDEVLKAAFDDYIPKPSIPKEIKGFEPDGSVKSALALIEYKFISSRDELKKAIDEIFADSVGYFSNENWKHFFVVFYLTDHFDRASTIESQIKNSCSHVDNVEVIVITGDGSRSNQVLIDPNKQRSLPNGGKLKKKRPRKQVKARVR